MTVITGGALDGPLWHARTSRHFTSTAGARHRLQHSDCDRGDDGAAGQLAMTWRALSRSRPGSRPPSGEGRDDLPCEELEPAAVGGHVGEVDDGV
ncbi:MAG: hypothetical protein OEP52_11080, partial [Acidimicrobiia bacterium]|nr:hypothetical protein [Acidimicrobiia bacterium]